MAEFAATEIVLIVGEMCHVVIVLLFSMEDTIQSKQFRFGQNVLKNKTKQQTTKIRFCPWAEKGITCVLLLQK